MSETEQFLLWLKGRIERELVVAEAMRLTEYNPKPCNARKGCWCQMSKADIATIKRMGKKRESIAKIAEVVGRERGTVRYWLKKLNLYNVRTKKHRVRSARRP